NRSQDGFSGGGQIGYNFQLTPGSGVVIGIEADAQYLDFGRSRNNAFVSGALAPGYYLTDPRGLSSLDFFGTVRGRLGYAFDRTLVYGTGGFAYGSGSADRSFGGFAGNDSFRTGYAVGGGIEYALPTDSFLNFFRSSAVTLKVEG
ncbi:outer membrane protein, partial [Methylobacterium longum]|uniref:outer membrane protein n=1 Tax=Methylobacterium longum TaxID=767694 RepID=UPI001EE30C9D